MAAVSAATVVYTDEGAISKGLGRHFEKHDFVNHSIGEYVRGPVHTNIIEGYFLIMKRGINGVYHHVSVPNQMRTETRLQFEWRAFACAHSALERGAGDCCVYRKPYPY